MFTASLGVKVMGAIFLSGWTPVIERIGTSILGAIASSKLWTMISRA